MLIVLLATLTGCYAAGPAIVLVPARKTRNPEPVQAAAPFKVPIYVELADGSITQSRNIVEFPAGVWILDYQPEP